MKNDKLFIIMPNDSISEILKNMVNKFKSHYSEIIILDDDNNIPDLRDSKILFVLELNNIGVDIPMIKFMHYLKNRGNEVLYGSIGAIIIHSSSDFGTKRTAQDIIFTANNMGCTFIGHPLVECTKTLSNFLTWKKALNMPLEDICYFLTEKLAERLKSFIPAKVVNPNFLVLYSSTHKFSNTLQLWNMVKKNLSQCEIKEIYIENGKVQDCKGCSYKLCVHYGEQNSCFYGGLMVEDILPSIEKSDSIIWLCPNFNDSLTANITAVINRLTVLYNKLQFYDKSIYGIIVSGSSGSDSVAKQLIGSLNINKGFILYPYAILTATANDPNAILSVSNIDSIAKNFGENIMNSIVFKKI